MWVIKHVLCHVSSLWFSSRREHFLGLCILRDLVIKRTRGTEDYMQVYTAGGDQEWTGAGMRHQYGGSFLALLRDVFLSSFLSEPTLHFQQQTESVCIPLPVTDTLCSASEVAIESSEVVLSWDIIIYVLCANQGSVTIRGLRCAKHGSALCAGNPWICTSAQSTDCATHTCVRVFGSLHWSALDRASWWIGTTSKSVFPAPSYRRRKVGAKWSV